LATTALGVEGVVDVSDVRVRRSGPHAHADVTVSVGRTTSVEQSHVIAEAVRGALQEAEPGTSAVVTVRPSAEGEDVVGRVFAAANRVGLADQVHNVLAVDHPEGLWLMLHAKVPPSTPLRRAHEVTDELERELRGEIDGLARVEIHLEPREPQSLQGRVVSAHEDELVRACRELAERHRPITRCHEVAVSEVDGGLHIVLHCEARPDTPIVDIHEASQKVEDEIHRTYPRVRTVTVHFEPMEDDQ
jgi:divalent metal cation (Fe/Co/Zn/Cd) transporter